MVEFITVLFVLTATAIIGALIWYFFRDLEQITTFDEAYGKKLLADEKTQKNKNKPVVKKPKAKNNVDKPKQSEESSKIKSNSSKENLPNDQCKTQSFAEALKQNNPTQPKIENKVPKNDLYDVVKANGDEWKENNAIKKNKKRNRIQKSENDEGSNNEGENEETPLTQTIIEKTNQVSDERFKESKVVTAYGNTKQTKIHVKRAIAKDLTFSDVFDRIKLLNDLEPEYVDYLARFSEQSINKEQKLNENILAQKKDLSEKDRLTKQLNADNSNLHFDISELKKKISDKDSMYQTLESTVQLVLSENYKIKEDNKRLNNIFAQRDESENRYKKHISELEKNLQQLEYQNAEINKRYCESYAANNESAKQGAELQRLTEHFNQTKQAQQKAEEQCMHLSEELKNLHYLYQKNTMLNAEINELNLVKKNLSDELHAWKTRCNSIESQQEVLKTENEKVLTNLNHFKTSLKEVNGIKEKYQSEHSRNSELEDQLNGLNKKLDISQKKVADFEEWHKKIVNEKESNQETVKQNQKLIEEMNEILSRKLELEEQLKSANSELVISHQKLADFEEWSKIVQKEKDVNQEVLKRNKQLEEEINRLKNHSNRQDPKQDELKSTLLALEKELQEQKNRTQDLRETNYKLVEAIQTQETAYKKLLTGTEKSEAATNQLDIKHLVGLIEPLAASVRLTRGELPEDLTALLKWTAEIVKAVNQRLTETPPAINGDATAQLKDAQARAKTLENTLRQVRVFLFTVEQIADETEQEKNAEIAALKAKLQKALQNN